jgi:hypothetical protein
MAPRIPKILNAFLSPEPSHAIGDTRMKNNPIFLLSTFVLLSLSCSIGSLSINPVLSSGVLTSESRSLSGFQVIALTGSADVDVRFGETEAVVVETDSAILPFIETTVENGNLAIGTKPNAVLPPSPIHVHVVMKTLQSISLSGSGDIHVSNLAGNILRIDLSGSGDISVSGRADTVEITLTGSGDVNCMELIARTATITLNGSGDVNIFVNSSLTANLHGSGNIRFQGNPIKVQKLISGSGDIRPSDPS